MSQKSAHDLLSDELVDSKNKNKLNEQARTPFSKNDFLKRTQGHSQ